MWQIEAIPNELEIKETGYTKSILFVRQEEIDTVRLLFPGREPAKSS